MPKLKIFLFLAISFVMLTTAFGHNSSVSCCIVFNSLNTHVTWSVASHPRVPDAARRESSSGVKPKSEKDNALMASLSSLLFSTSNVPTSFKISSPEYADPKKDITCEKPYGTNIYRELRIKNLLPLGFLTLKLKMYSRTKECTCEARGMFQQYLLSEKRFFVLKSRLQGLWKSFASSIFFLFNRNM